MGVVCVRSWTCKMDLPGVNPITVQNSYHVTMSYQSQLRIFTTWPWRHITCLHVGWRLNGKLCHGSVTWLSLACHSVVETRVICTTWPCMTNLNSRTLPRDNDVISRDSISAEGSFESFEWVQFKNSIFKTEIDLFFTKTTWYAHIWS